MQDRDPTARQNLLRRTTGPYIWVNRASFEMSEAGRSDRGGLTTVDRADVGHEITRQVGVKGVHRRLVGGGSAEPDEAVRPYEDGSAVGNSCLGRIEGRA
jgi:hypothetical protein